MSSSLFRTVSGRPTAPSDLQAALRSVGAHDCDILFLHSGMTFGVPAARRMAILQGIWEALANLQVRTLCVPAFTFSFQNNEVFDPDRSPSRMGALGEYVRNLPQTVRSRDPLMSVALVGERRDLVTRIGDHSCGAESTFHNLSKADGVKFAFLGVRAGECFTYMHHLEWQAAVPYRYNREFRGRIRRDGAEWDGRAILNVRYRGVLPGDGSFRYEDIMKQRGVLLHADFGDGFVRCVAERDAAPVFLDLLRQDPNFFLRHPFDVNSADPTFETDGVMVAM